MVISVACIQTKPELNQKERNIAQMCEWIEKTMSEHPKTQLIVFPELATTGYECGATFQELAEIADKDQSSGIMALSQLAKKYGVHIVFGFAERDAQEPDRLYNAQGLLDPEGQLVGTYRKIHLFDTEKAWFTPGDAYKVFPTTLGRLGLFICYDASFPEAARSLTLMGADILINSTNWEKPYDRDMLIFMQTRALENTTSLICCNRIGTDQHLSFFGKSRIFDPLGHVLAQEDQEVECILTADIDMAYTAHVRSNYYTMLKERRTDTYRLL